MQYLYDRNVNIVIGNPLVRPLNYAPKEYFTVEDIGAFFIPDTQRRFLPSSARVVEIPIDSRYKIAILYLNPHVAVDRLIRERKLKTYEIKDCEPQKLQSEGVL